VADERHRGQFPLVMTPAHRRVAIVGELGGFAHDAVHALYGDAADVVAVGAAHDAIAALGEATADFALLPLETSLGGAVGDVHDAIAAAPGVHAVAETIVDTHFCLAAPRGSTVDAIATVLSHDAAAAQCEAFFRARPRVQVHGSYDVAAAAREVAQLGDPSFAALTTHRAAARSGLDVIAANIEDRHDAQARYVSLARTPATPPAGVPVRTLVMFTTADAPGALLAALQPFAAHGVNVRRMETRPSNQPWSYRFFVEFDHELGAPNTAAAVADVARAAESYRTIGTYARWDAGGRGSIGWTPTDIPFIA
jgi:prephenate dehydratase